MKIDVSIIVPIYNVENYLKKCVESILTQSVNVNEIILVNDGSTDNSGLICDDYGKRFNRIKVIHKSNGGPSEARNLGVEMCDSDYVVFVDPDDYVDQKYIEHLIETKDRTNATIVCTQLKQEKEGTVKKNDKTRNAVQEEMVDSITAQAYILRGRYKGIGVSPCAKLFPKELIIKHPYNVGKRYEDLRTTFWHFGDVDRVAFATYSDYHYVQRSGGFIHSDQSFDSIMEALSICEGFEIYSADDRIKRACAYRVYRIIADYMKGNNLMTNEQIKLLQNKVKRYANIQREDKETGKIDKTKFWLLTHNESTFHIYAALQKMYRKVILN